MIYILIVMLANGVTLNRTGPYAMCQSMALMELEQQSMGMPLIANHPSTGEVSHVIRWTCKPVTDGATS